MSCSTKDPKEKTKQVFELLQKKRNHEVLNDFLGNSTDPVLNAKLFNEIVHLSEIVELDGMPDDKDIKQIKSNSYPMSPEFQSEFEGPDVKELNTVSIIRGKEQQWEITMSFFETKSGLRLSGFLTNRHYGE